MNRLLRVFPRRTSYTPTDSMAFVGLPPLLRPARSEVDEVHVSCTMTWDMSQAAMLRDAWAEQYPGIPARLGGPAYPDSYGDGSFTPGRYLKPGYTFTSRGCNNNCGWCLVPQREGRLRELPIVPGHIVQDNNILQCSPRHIEAVFEMLRRLKQGAVFAGGLAPDRLWDSPHFTDALIRIRVRELFLAADTNHSVERFLPPAVGLLQRQGFTRNQTRCYMLCGYGNDTPPIARARLEQAWQIGVLPFAQLYQPADLRISYGPEWKALAREWSRPAAMVAMHKRGE